MASALTLGHRWSHAGRGHLRAQELALEAQHGLPDLPLVLVARGGGVERPLAAVERDRLREVGRRDEQRQCSGVQLGAEQVEGLPVRPTCAAGGGAGWGQEFLLRYWGFRKVIDLVKSRWARENSTCEKSSKIRKVVGRLVAHHFLVVWTLAFYRFRWECKRQTLKKRKEALQRSIQLLVC